jgi:hypothetical protein
MSYKWHTGLRYVIKRNDGKYVAKPGSEHSYTQLLQRATVFNSYSDAERDLCPENERICLLDEELEQG